MLTLIIGKLRARINTKQSKIDKAAADKRSNTSNRFSSFGDSEFPEFSEKDLASKADTQSKKKQQRKSKRK